MPLEELRKTGIVTIGDVPWGMHFCQFYQSQQDLADILVPYFKAGLENNEFCMWVTADPLNVGDARQAMRRAMPDFDAYVARGQIEIIPYSDWYIKDGDFNSDRVLNGWVEKLNNALTRGFSGLRLTGNTFWLEPARWQSFTDYEAAIDGVIGNYRMIALCTYSLEKCGAYELLDVVSNHRFALIKRAGHWQTIENTRDRELRQALAKSEERYRSLFNGISEGVAFHQIILDADGEPADYRFLEVNAAFEKLTGLTAEQVIGRTVKQVLPGIEDYWIKEYGKVALTGKQAVFENYSANLGKWYEVYTYSPESGYFVTLVLDVTRRKLLEEERARDRKILQTIMDNAHTLLVYLDPDFNFIAVNAAYAENSKHTPEELIGKNHFSFYPHEENEAIFKHARDTGQAVYYHDKPFVFPDQPERGVTYWDWKLTPVKDEEGNVEGLVFSLVETTERKKAEETIENLASFPGENPNPVMRIAGDGKVIYANPASQVLQDFWQCQVGKTLPLPHLKFIQDALLSGETRMDEIIYRDRIFALTFTPIPQKGYVNIYGRDITERKQVEESLRRNEGELSTILANIPILMLLVDPERRVLKVNDAVEKFAHRPSGEMLGLRGGEVLGCVNAFDDPRGCGFGQECQYCKTRLTVLDTFETGTNHYQVEWRLPFLRDGKKEEITFLLSTVRMPSPERQVLVCIEDISELKRAEEAVKEARDAAESERRRLATILRMVPSGVVIVEKPDGRITYVNEQAFELYGMDPRGLVMEEHPKIGMRRMDGSPYPAENLPTSRALLRGEVVRDEELIIARPGGERVIVSANAVPLRDRSGEIVAAIGAFIDITERKKIDQLKDEFIGMVSHELKTPLTVVTGALYTAMTRGVSQKDKKDLLRDAVSGAEELAGIIDNLLELSRYQANRLQLNIEPVNVSKVIHSVIGKLSKKSSLHHLVADIPQGLPEVKADPFRLERILYNLIDNAIKYSPKGGRVMVSAQKYDASVVVAVRDRGMGISPENQAVLFEPFQRVPQSYAGIAGVGLGLHVCRRLLEVQGGHIWVESEVGKGSTFYFTLPRAQ